MDVKRLTDLSIFAIGGNPTAESTNVNRRGLFSAIEVENDGSVGWRRT